MPITELLERNAASCGDEVALVEINPELREKRVTWREYELVENPTAESYRREMTWRDFDERANRFANCLIERGLGGAKVAILLMNCLEWLPVYFGILKAGSIAVPLNFRYTADEIKYCVELADCDAIVFGTEFIGRLESICEHTPRIKDYIFVGDGCPGFAEPYAHLVKDMPATKPDVKLTDEDFAAIYFSSGTTGFPTAILHKHASRTHSAAVPHGREDALVRQPLFLQQGGAPARHKA